MAVFRRLSPLSVSRWALCTSRSRIASAMVGLAIVSFAKLVAVDWITRHQGLLICGPTGTGKSWLACARPCSGVRLARPQSYPDMTPIATCQCQGIKQPWHSLIEDGTIVAARLVAERTGKPTFARTGRAADQQALVPCDPVAGDELGE